jgi:bifunctional oligoribonuclease and PAP phosphatase NrnA
VVGPSANDIAAVIERAGHILVVTHIAPDGDALGSLTAFGLLLQQLGKQSTLVVDDGLPDRFDFLPLADQVRTTPDPAVVYDLLVTLDSGDTERLGKAYTSLPDPRPFIINIDHHITNTRYGQINVIDPQASSTTEILCHLLPQLGVGLTYDIAVCLLTGLLTDTLGLRTASVTAETLRVASALVETGADLFTILTQALIVKPLSTLYLWQKGLNNVQLSDGLIWTSLSREERAAIGHTSSGTDGLGNMLADIHPVAMSAVLQEMEDGRIIVGFRCRPPYNVADLAAKLGGGGHHLASGCTLDGPLEEAEARVVASCQAAIRQQRAILKRSANPT